MIIYLLRKCEQTRVASILELTILASMSLTHGDVQPDISGPDLSQPKLEQYNDDIPVRTE